MRGRAKAGRVVWGLKKELSAATVGPAEREAKQDARKRRDKA